MTVEEKLEQIAALKRAFPMFAIHTHPAWIPVSERLPEPFIEVLVFVGMIDVGWVDEDGDWITQRYHGEVSWWMPLPEPPSE